MPLWLPLLVLAVLLTALRFGLSRHAELGVLEVHGGRAVVRRGKLPPRLRQDLDDVLRRAGVQRVRLRVLRAGDAARLEIRPSLGAGTEQQLRNVLGTWPLARLR